MFASLLLGSVFTKVQTGCDKSHEILVEETEITWLCDMSVLIYTLLDPVALESPFASLNHSGTFSNILSICWGYGKKSQNKKRLTVTTSTHACYKIGHLHSQNSNIYLPPSSSSFHSEFNQNVYFIKLKQTQQTLTLAICLYSKFYSMSPNQSVFFPLLFNFFDIC